MDIKTGNEIISEFMGWRDNYKSSWNQLMPVVEKIESLGIVSVRIHANYCTIKEHVERGTMFHCGSMDRHTKISATWETVIQFIQWHQSQETTN